MVGDSSWADVGTQASRQVDRATSLAEKVKRQVNAALQPLFTDVTADWGVWSDFLAYKSSPAVAHTVFSGDRRLLFAILRPQLSSGRQLPPTSVITVEAMRPNGTRVAVRMNVALRPDRASSHEPSSHDTMSVGASVFSTEDQYRVRYCHGELVHRSAVQSMVRDLETVTLSQKPADREMLSLAARYTSHEWIRFSN